MDNFYIGFGPILCPTEGFDAISNEMANSVDPNEMAHCEAFHLELYCLPLRKHAYSNILKILSPKNENFQIKFFDIFHISAQNIDRGYS